MRAALVAVVCLVWGVVGNGASPNQTTTVSGWLETTANFSSTSVMHGDVKAGSSTTPPPVRDVSGYPLTPGVVAILAVSVGISAVTVMSATAYYMTVNAVPPWRPPPRRHVVTPTKFVNPCEIADGMILIKMIKT